ncbi:30S ribosomal protein S6 [Candidatus Poribacteria bacterium]|nr:30S ribosomal protein S6 [Candidatus Poribacteria bacterium]
MNTYETIFIVNPNISSEDVETQIQKVTTIITDNKGEVVAIERWGVRRLAYKVKKFNRGTYVFIKIKAENAVLDELQRYFRITDSVIKFIIVKEKIHRIKGEKLEKGATPQPIKIEVGSDIITHPEDELA